MKISRIFFLQIFIHVVKHMDIVLLPSMYRNIAVVKIRSFHRVCGRRGFRCRQVYTVHCLRRAHWRMFLFHGSRILWISMHIHTSNLLYIYQASDKEIPIKVCYIRVLCKPEQKTVFLYYVSVASRMLWWYVCRLSVGSWQYRGASDSPLYITYF
jgi:hypothetical protein